MHANKNLKTHAILSSLIIALGVVLMVMKIYADSEPGAIPLLLVVSGIGWCVAARFRARAHDQ